jgi:hypothetical protein
LTATCLVVRLDDLGDDALISPLQHSTDVALRVMSGE